MDKRQHILLMLEELNKEPDDEWYWRAHRANILLASKSMHKPAIPALFRLGWHAFAHATQEDDNDATAAHVWAVETAKRCRYEQHAAIDETIIKEFVGRHKIKRLEMPATKRLVAKGKRRKTYQRDVVGAKQRW